jgi:cytosine/adenosine deaminase-related metal-dependent hydrolase
MTIWIRHGIVISPGKKPQIWTPGRVLIEGDKIVRVESDEGNAHPNGAETIDASGCVVFPGQVLLHTHCYGFPARGMPPLGKAPRTFLDVLRQVWWPLDRALTLPAVGLAARLYLWELLRAGVTCAFDHHASYGAIQGSLAEIASAFEEAGVRGGTCFEISSRCGARAAAAAIEENVHYIRDIAPRFRLAPLIGLHASFTLSEKVVEHVAALAEELGVGVHSHLCEGPTDRQLSGVSPVRRWARLGFLNEKSLFAHGTDLRQAECELFAESGATIVLNPRSNLSNAVGLPDVLNLSRSGVRLALGNDGFGTSLCAEAQTALGTFATQANDPSFGWSLLNEILFLNNPEIAGRHLGTTLGVIQPGAAADIAVIPYRPLTSIDASSILEHYLFGFGSVPARDVIVAGKVRLRHGAPIGFQPEEWAAQARHIFPRVWQQRSLRGFRVSRAV